MRTSILAVAVAIAQIAHAQTSGQLPTCAQSCVNNYTQGSAIAGCGNFDIHCICASGDFLSGIACCLAASCGAADIDAAVKFAGQICLTGNPPVTVPTAVTCTSTAAKTAGTGSTSAGTTSAATTSAAQATGAAATSTGAAPASTSNAAGVNKVGGAGMGLVGGLAALVLL